MVTVRGDIKIDAVVFESNRTDNWVYSLTHSQGLKSARSGGGRKKRMNGKNGKRIVPVRVKRRRRKRRKSR